MQSQMYYFLPYRSQVFLTLVIFGVICTASAQDDSSGQKICPTNEDYDNMCKTNFRFKDQHVYPENINILMDSYSYTDLQSTFRITDADNDEQTVRTTF